MEAAYAKETAGLEGVPDGLKPILENPTAYAGNAVQDARYESFEIRTHGGVAEIETATREGRRVRSYQNAEQLQAGMERDGVNAFLTGQVRDQQAVLNATVDALWAGRDNVVLRIEPERLTRVRAEVAALTWQPGGHTDASGGRVPREPARCRSARGPALMTHARSVGACAFERPPGRLRARLRMSGGATASSWGAIGGPPLTVET